MHILPINIVRVNKFLIQKLFQSLVKHTNKNIYVDMSF